MMKKVFLILLFISALLPAQSITFDEFLEVSKEHLNTDALKELLPLFPKNFVVTSADIGDFSGDNKNDFAIALKPYRSNRGINIYLFCDSLSHYSLIYQDTLDFVELPVEIGFSIKQNKCFITHKIKEKNWDITGYTYLKNQLRLVDYYTTDVINVKKVQLGEEHYQNYEDLKCFWGNYDVNTLGDFKKINYIIHPVYGRNRNIYCDFPKSVNIDNSWLWNIADSNVTNVFGRIAFSRNGGMLISEITLNEDLAGRIDTSRNSKILICIDRSGSRLSDMNRRTPVFREKQDANISTFQTYFNPANPGRAEFEPKWGANFNSSAHQAAMDIRREKDLKFSCAFPFENLKTSANQKELGVFVKLEIYMKSGPPLILTNSNGYAEDPSSYGRLLLIDRGNYYGSIKNPKFRLIMEKLKLNGFGAENENP
ncbi:MAG: hypothetical protein ACM3Q2_02365 [Syntrophothermus sp.]